MNNFENRFHNPFVAGLTIRMIDLPPSVIFLPGSGGGTPDFSVFRTRSDDATRFESIGYPDWRRCVADDFSAEIVIAELVAEIVARVPQGPIRIIGLSLGGHFGYAAALRLQKMGREIAGLCAIDSFMIVSSEPSQGWKGRAFAQGVELLRARRFGDFIRFLRSKFWRALLRLAGSRLPNLIRKVSFFGRPPLVNDPIVEQELSMRLLIREVAPWIASFDREPVALKAPAALLRTRFTSSDDPAWHRRCPYIQIFEIAGQHHTLFEPENIGSLREAFVAATRDWR